MTDYNNFGDIQLRDLASRHGTFFNPVASDADGGREVVVDFKGRDSLENKHQMVAFRASHSGSSTDYRGKLVIEVNDGTDVDGSLSTVFTATSSLTSISTATSVAGFLSATGKITGSELLVTTAGIDVTGDSTFADTVTINGTGTALDVVNGNMNVGGTLTVGTFQATSYTGLDLDDVADSATRFAMTDGTQSFSGNKTFWNVVSNGGFSLGTGGTKLQFWDAANTNRLWFHEDLKTKVRGTMSFVDVSEDANPATHDSTQSILVAKSTAPWLQVTRTLDQAGSTDVILGKYEFSGQHSDVYRTGAKIHAVTSSTQWDSSDSTIAPTELQFFTQSATALTDALTSPAVTIDSDGDLIAAHNLDVTDQLNCNKATGYSLVTANNAKINGYVEMTGITVLTGGTNSIAGNLSLTGGLTVAQNSGTSIDVTGTAPVNIASTLNANGALNVAGAAALTLASGTGLAVTANATVGGTLAVTGTTSVGDTLSLTKATGTGLDVTSNVTVGGDLTVTGAFGTSGDLTGVNITSSGVLTASGPNVAFVVTNNATVGGTLAVTGATSVGALTGGSSADFTGTVSCLAPSGTGLAVTKNATIGGTLAVTGVSTLTGAVTASSTITSSGVITVNESLTNVGIRNEGICEFVGEVKCLEAAGTALSVSGNATVAKLLTLTKVTAADYALDSYGNAKFRDDVEVLENLSVTGTSTLTGNLSAAVGTFSGVLTANKASGTGLSVTNNAVVGGTLSAGATTLASGSVTDTLVVNGLLTASKAGQLALSVTGNATVGGTLAVTGATTLNGAATMDSCTVTNAVTINQASGTGLDVVNANARIGGDLTVVGNMIVSGTTTTVNTETLTVSDNIIVVNETPLSSKDSGIVMQRYSADVAGDSAKEAGTLDGAGTSVATLPSGLTGAADEFYTGWYIKITNDSPVGAQDQVRKITGYTHSTRVIDVDSDWTTQPDATSTFNLYNRPFVGLTYDESADEFALVATALDPTDTINIQEYLNLHVNNIITAGETTLGGDLTVGNFSVSEPGAEIEIASAGPAMKFIKDGVDKLLMDTATTTMYGGLTMNDGKLIAKATSGDAIQVTQGSTTLLDVALTGQLNITGGSTISQWLTVNGGLQVNAAQNVTGVVTASNTVNITGTGDLDCDGLAHFSQPVTMTSSLSGASATLSTTLGVTGVATFTAQSVHTNGIDANGSSDIDTLVVSGTGTALSVTNSMTAAKVTAGANGLVSNGPVDVNSTSDFSGTLTCSKSTGNGLSVVAGSDLQGTVTAGGDVGISGTLTGVAGTFSGTLTAAGAGGLSVTNALSAGSISTTGTLAVTGAGNLDCDGAADFASTVNVTGLLSGAAGTFSTTLGVTGIATFTAQSVHNGGIDVNAASDILSLTVSGTGTGLAVTHNATVGGTLAVTGTSSYTGMATFAGGIDVNAASDITSLTVSGAGTSLTVNNTASLGALSVAGTSTLTGVVTMPAGFDSNAASTVSKLTIDGTDTTSLVVDQGASIAGALDVTGVTTLTGAAALNGGLTSTTGAFTGTISSSKATGDGLTVVADATIDGKLRVGASGTYTPVDMSVSGLVPKLHLFHDNSNEISANNELGEIGIVGKDFGAWRQGAAIRFQSTTSWSNTSPTDTKAPSRITFHCEDSGEGSTLDSAVMRILSDAVDLFQPMSSTAAVSFTNTLGVSGATTLAAVTASGTVSLTKAGVALDVTNDADIGGILTVTGASTLTGAVTASSTVDVADTVSITKASGTGLSVTADASVGGSLTVTGDLIVSGSTTTIDTATLAVEDHNIELGMVATPSDATADGGGITLKGTTDKTITYDNTNTSWDSSESVNVVSGKEYRIDDAAKLTNTTVYLGSASGDGVVYLGDDVDGSWRIDVDGSGDLRFSKKVTGSWVTKQTIA
jgi:fibronectin-binding autotransporter adhesin